LQFNEVDMNENPDLSESVCERERKSVSVCVCLCLSVRECTGLSVQMATCPHLNSQIL